MTRSFAVAQKTGGFASNPFLMMVGLGAGVMMVIALAIAVTRPTVGEAVGSGPVAAHGAAAEDHAEGVVEAEADAPAEEAA
ncbi:MAG: hypothetical protein ACJAQV_001489, partial [Loktanella salsilacus]